MSYHQNSRNKKSVNEDEGVEDEDDEDEDDGGDDDDEGEGEEAYRFVPRGTGEPTADVLSSLMEREGSGEDSVASNWGEFGSKEKVGVWFQEETGDIPLVMGTARCIICPTTPDCHMENVRALATLSDSRIA